MIPHKLNLTALSVLVEGLNHLRKVCADVWKPNTLFCCVLGSLYGTFLLGSSFFYNFFWDEYVKYVLTLL